MKILPDFYLRDDVVLIARELIGKVLVVKHGSVNCAGIITETEAYTGINDRASHAYNNRRTARTEVMFGRGGHAYVYLCYGIHSLFNVVSNEKGVPHAILLRAIYPVSGIHEILERIGKKALDYSYFNGPGKLTKALGINVSDTGANLVGDRIWIEDRGIRPEDDWILVGPRIGIDYAGEDASLPYRFQIDPLMITRLSEIIL